MILLIVQYIMIRKSAVLSTLCLLLSMSFNSTFPLRSLNSQPTKLNVSSKPESYGPSIVERTKKMACNIEHALKKFKYSTQDFGRKLFTGNSSLNADDILEFEQLVIMKKYPFLDIKDLQEKYSPTMKNIRQSLKYAPSQDFNVDTRFYEPAEEGLPSVEIFNRGLSGFSIPPVLNQLGAAVEQKIGVNFKRNDPQENKEVDEVPNEISNNEQRTKSELHTDLVEFRDVLVNRKN